MYIDRKGVAVLIYLDTLQLLSCAYIINIRVICLEGQQLATCRIGETVMTYTAVQAIAKKTMEYTRKIIRPGMHLTEIRKLCEGKLRELGADSFWYWDVGAFVFAGDETTISISGAEYQTSGRTLGMNDIITIDLSPQMDKIWGDYARTIILEDGCVVDSMGILYGNMNYPPCALSEGGYRL